MDTIMDIFVFIAGIGALLKLILSLWGARKKAQDSGIIQFHVTAGSMLFMMGGIALALTAYQAGVCFYNSGIYQREANRARQYGISELLETIDIPENGTVDIEGTAKRYIAEIEKKASGARVAGLRDLGIFLTLLLFNINACGGYVTRDGWIGICGKEIRLMTVRPENGNLCFYTGTADKPVLMLPDTPEQRERYEVFLPDGSENQTDYKEV